MLPSPQDNGWSWYRSLLMAGYIQGSRELSFPLKLNKTGKDEQFKKHEWLGMKVTNILPALVFQQFRASAQNHD
jgi:hypothetical protein